MNVLGHALNCIKCHSLPINAVSAKVNVFGIINVRFRKSRWARRRAPSKMYYVRQPTPKDPDEMTFLEREDKIYNTKIKSIYAYLKSQEQPISQALKASSSNTVDETNDLDKVLEINKKWNEAIAWERSVRQEEEAKVVEQFKRSRLAKYHNLLDNKQLKACETIQRTTARRAASVDMDKLDETVDTFLEQEPVDHNFAISSAGERISN